MKHLFTLLSISLLLSACIKDDVCPYLDGPVNVQTAQVDRLRDKLNNYGYPYTASPEGYFYMIQAEGTGSNPGVCSSVRFEVVGKLFNGTVFESSGTNGVSFVLGQAIIGIQKGMIRLKPGGSITLYIPPFLGYGPNDVRDPDTNALLIPGDSDLIYEIRLISVD